MHISHFAKSNMFHAAVRDRKSIYNQNEVLYIR